MVKVSAVHVKERRSCWNKAYFFGTEDALRCNLPFCKKVTCLKKPCLASANTSANRVMGVS